MQTSTATVRSSLSNSSLSMSHITGPQVTPTPTGKALIVTRAVTAAPSLGRAVSPTAVSWESRSEGRQGRHHKGGTCEKDPPVILVHEDHGHHRGGDADTDRDQADREEGAGGEPDRLPQHVRVGLDDVNAH